MTSIEHRLSKELRAFADITVTEGDIMQAQDQLQQRVTVATRHRNYARLAAAAAVVAAAAAGTLWFAQSDSQSGTPPVNQPTQLVPDPQARSVAASFVNAYASFDTPAAAAMIAARGGASGVGLDSDWRLFNKFLEATGGELLLHPCTPVSTGASGTAMRCPFDYHALRSGEIGRGPFTGSSFDVTVLDGRIVAASLTFEYASNGFSADMWEPFAAWVSRTHPRDAAIMYADWPRTSQQRMTPAALDLWSEHTRGYVDHVLANRAGAAPGRPG
jgi:hypothetical protein